MISQEYKDLVFATAGNDLILHICQGCSSVVNDMEKHDRWHIGITAGALGFGAGLFP